MPRGTKGVVRNGKGRSLFAHRSRRMGFAHQIDRVISLRRSAARYQSYGVYNDLLPSDYHLDRGGIWLTNARL